MALVSFELALGHLRANAGEEDELIALYLDAAQQSAVDYLNRSVYPDQDSLDAAQESGSAGANPMVINSAIQAAILKTLGELYGNRENSIVGATVFELPLSARTLLRPHRIVQGV